MPQIVSLLYYTLGVLFLRTAGVFTLLLCLLRFSASCSTPLYMFTSNDDGEWGVSS